MTTPEAQQGIEQVEARLDIDFVIGRLNELGIDVEREELEGEDDNDTIGNITMYATMYDFDIDDVLPQVTPIEGRAKSELGEVWPEE
jgi:hypothetical protein